MCQVSLAKNGLAFRGSGEQSPSIEDRHTRTVDFAENADCDRMCRMVRGSGVSGVPRDRSLKRKRR